MSIRRCCSWRSRSIPLLVAFCCVGAFRLVAVAAPPDAQSASQERSLFNGHDLRGWNGDPAHWSVEDGAITGRTTADKPISGNTFLIWTEGEVDDFELRLKYRIEGGNSGIQYRSRHLTGPDLGRWVVGGYQADIDSGGKYTGCLYDERGRGILAERGQRTRVNDQGKPEVTGSLGTADALLAKVHADDWNDYKIVARGNHFVHSINGQVMCEVTDDDAAKAVRSGILALQLHQGPPMKVQFKDVVLKRLPLTDRKKIVLVAGTPSHGPGDHEFNAGVLLLKDCLDRVPGVVTAAYLNGWPRDPSAFDNANSVMLYMDGGGRHPLIQGDHLAQMRALIERGVGLVCAHYAVEIPKEDGGPELLDWIGGYYETGYSINPHWVASFKDLPDHPVRRGVKPFAIRDEWYFNIRFRPDDARVVPILKATPPDDVRRTEAAAAHPGRAETVAWAVERADGGRGFGFTGGHNHINWSDDYFRKLILNALVWTAGGDVPTDGVPSKVSAEAMKRNLDPKPQR